MSRKLVTSCRVSKGTGRVFAVGPYLPHVSMTTADWGSVEGVPLPILAVPSLRASAAKSALGSLGHAHCFSRAITVFFSAGLADSGEIKLWWSISNASCKEPHNVISARRLPPAKNNTLSRVLATPAFLQIHAWRQ